MSEAILVLNAGTSTIKFALYPAEDGETPLLRGVLEGLIVAPRFKARWRDGTTVDESPVGVGADAASCIAWLFDWFAQHLAGFRIVGAGHRVVHGGEQHAAPVRIDAQVIAALEALIPLARTHEPHEIAAIKAVAALVPGLPQVACFDTAFHHAMPRVARSFALPRELSEAGVRRYGFHGLSYEYIAQTLPHHLGSAANGRVIVAHLGSGASLCAMRGRRSIATTMGFTTLDGLMMSTRCGAIDPGALLYLIQERALTANQVSDILYKRSGLLGVSGLSGDMRALLASSAPQAAEAIELFVYRALLGTGAFVAALGGLDALVFTGGIGEHSHEIRARICAGLDWVGVVLDPAANRRNDILISSTTGGVAVCAIPTDEEMVIARHTRTTLDIPRRTPQAV